MTVVGKHQASYLERDGGGRRRARALQQHWLTIKARTGCRASPGREGIVKRLPGRAMSFATLGGADDVTAGMERLSQWRYPAERTCLGDLERATRCHRS